MLPRVLSPCSSWTRVAAAAAAAANMAPKKAGKPTTASSSASVSAKRPPPASSTPSSGRACWLMKAEPEPRLERGIDISFGIDKFAAMPQQTTTWDGVRNPEARTMMKDAMKVDDLVLFYHSSCALPGIAGLARVVRQGYPDHTAWDPSHPYYDPKTDKDNPKWYMVDVQLERRLPRLVPLALLQDLRDKGPEAASQALPNQYLSPRHIEAIAQMQLLNRGRLSVQRVEPIVYEAIVLLADKGGWEAWPGKWNKVKGSTGKNATEKAAAKTSSRGATMEKGNGTRGNKATSSSQSTSSSKRKPKAQQDSAPIPASSSTKRSRRSVADETASSHVATKRQSLRR